MKIFVRAFVVILALSGAVATTQMNASSTSTSSKITLSKTSAFPVPTCEPGDPNGCGMGGN